MSTALPEVHAHRVGQRIPLESPKSEAATILIFGASGDLTARKLVPALFMLWRHGFLADQSAIVGVARRDKSDDAFRDELHDSVCEFARGEKVTDEEWSKFASRLFYRRADLTEPEDFQALRRGVEKLEQDRGISGKRVVYLATAPELFLPSVEALSTAGMVPAPDAKETLRVVLEKPFGHDLKSAQELSRQLSRLLSEDQIYRIDHYLGKETVQNILLFRFGNSIFEPLLNRNQVDHVQITVAESQGIEHGRGGYYDKAGAMRDVLQNHVLQLLCLLAMEPPAYFLARNIQDEKMKVLQALAPGEPGGVKNWAVAGQFSAGEMNGESVVGYHDEDRIPPGSTRETFVAMEVRVDNWRWAGVPFYLRTGKRLPQRVTEIAVQFKSPPLQLFQTVECEGDICDLVGARPNTLVFRIQPRESISLKFSTKRPGMQYQIHPVTMDFAYESAFEQGLPEAYERLLLDVLRGDPTLFTRNDELEAAWRFVQPVLDAWDDASHVPQSYAAGSWGPQAAHELLSRSGRQWRVPALPPKRGT